MAQSRKNAPPKKEKKWKYSQCKQKYTGFQFLVAFLCSILELIIKKHKIMLGQNTYENVVSEFKKKP